jgi:hypothetical protein
MQSWPHYAFAHVTWDDPVLGITEGRFTVRQSDIYSSK